MVQYPELELFVAGEWRRRDGAPVDSGYGREGGTEGLERYTVAKNVPHLVL
jgi:hypothetical protein